MLRVVGHSAGHRSQVARRHFYIFIVFALIGPLLSAKQAASTIGEPAQLNSFSGLKVPLDFRTQPILVILIC